MALLYFLRMTPKLFKATDVCELAQLQPYVLRSWEKEFPGIGVQKADGQRLYRQSDVDQVLRIKQLVFTEGLTLSGARRRLDETPPVAASGEAFRIDGEPEVPDCRPSPMQGNSVMPCLMSSAGGCMFTTSAPPG